MSISELSDWLEGRAIEHFSARELCLLNTSHDFCDTEIAVPPKELWPNIEPTIKCVDLIREFWGAPVELGGGAGGGYRPEWYQRGLAKSDDVGTSTTFGDHCLFAGLDPSPVRYPSGKTRDDWYTLVRLSVDQIRHNQPDQPTALGWRSYYNAGQDNSHISIGVEPSRIGRSSTHARW